MDVDELRNYVEEKKSYANERKVEAHQDDLAHDWNYNLGKMMAFREVLDEIDALDSQTIGEQMESLESDADSTGPLQNCDSNSKTAMEEEEPIWPKKWSDIDPTPLNSDNNNTFRSYEGTIYINESAGSEDTDSNLWMPFDVYLTND